MTDTQVKKVLKERPKYLEIEEKFIKEYEAPLLDQRKKQLQLVRDFKKPLNGKDLLEHEMKYRARQID